MASPYNDSSYPSFIASMENSTSMARNPSDNSSSPFYLRPSDNPSRALLVSEIFTSENYGAWSWSISISLIVKNKIAVIDGSLLRPNLDDTHLSIPWLRANNLVLSWLMNSISKEIRDNLLYFTNAFDICEELKVRYLCSDGPRASLWRNHWVLFLKAPKLLLSILVILKHSWDEYISYHPLPTRHCGVLDTCTCAILKNLADCQQVDYLWCSSWLDCMILTQLCAANCCFCLYYLQWAKSFLCYYKKKANVLWLMLLVFPWLSCHGYCTTIKACPQMVSNTPKQKAKLMWFVLIVGMLAILMISAFSS